MTSKDAAGDGSIARYLAEDHAQLEAWLQAATADPTRVEAAAYDRFRAGLLRHIGIEEKILFLAVQRLCDGAPPALAAKLRLDHGALATLLMPTPSPVILSTLRRILTTHNALEEGPEGVYGACERALGIEADAVWAAIQSAPTVGVMPHSDSNAVMTTLHRVLARAGYRLDES